MDSQYAPDRLLAEQLSYYQALAGEYEDHITAPAGDLAAALDRFRPGGRVLELACGTGVWTEKLARHAASVTAVDGAPAMLARARARLVDPRVRFIEADLFGWAPDGRYDLVFFGFCSRAGNVPALQAKVHPRGRSRGDADLRPLLFHPFRRGQRVGPGKKGLGLGLYISKHLVEAHGGSIEVASSEPNGTTFTVCLPRQARSVAAAAEHRTSAG
jgi:SAM-dependent methyltransferase